MRTGNYSFSTERAYAVWIQRFLSSCAERGGKPDAGSVRDFLEHLALAREVVQRLLGRLTGEYSLMAGLLYGAGLRLMECLRLRVKDLDIDRGQITVRDGKMDKDRVTVLPERCRESLREHLARVRTRHGEDLRRGIGEVHLPPALERKYANAPMEWAWQWVFPADRLSVDPRSGNVRRWLGHADVSTTMIYTHVLNRPVLAVRSPLDATAPH